MGFVLAAIVITVFAAIFIPPLVNPQHEQFLPEASVSSPQGFDLYLLVNPVSVEAGGTVTVTIWMSNTGTQVDNVSAASSWPIGDFLSNPCPSGNPLPFGVEILNGYYTTDNATAGRSLQLVNDVSCVASSASPTFFAIAASGSQAIVPYGGSFQLWNLSSSFFPFGGFYQAGGSPSFYHFHGVYTVVAADEWGDLVVTHFSAD